MSETEEKLARVTAIFGLVGDRLDPEAFSGVANILPTESGRAGQERPGRRPPVQENFWRLEIQSEAIETDTVIRQLLDVLLPARNSIVEYVERTGTKAWLDCLVEIYDRRPWINVRSDTCSKLAALGLNIGFDIADYSDDEFLGETTQE